MSIYLNPELKAYYMADFDYLLNSVEDDFWKIDSGLTELLVRINQNEGLQTLYSKKIQDVKTDFLNPISYLRLAFVPDLEKPVQQICIELIQALDGREAQVNVSPEDGLENRIYKADSPMGCKNNPDYFKVKHFYIELRSEQEELHHRFWQMLEEKLLALTL